MKKILLATTMLAGTAGFASAEIAVTGWAELGVWNNNSVNGSAVEGKDGVAFWQEFEVRFIGTGSSDNGLEFGAQIDLDETNVAVNDDSGTHVWISGAFGKLTLGDTDGTVDWATTDMDGGVASIADDHTTHTAFFGVNNFDQNGDGQVARYENSFGDVAFAISIEQGSNGVVTGNYNEDGELVSTNRKLDEIYGVGVRYNADLGGTTVALGLGYQDGGNDFGKALGVSAATQLSGGFAVALGYVDYKKTDTATYVGKFGGYDNHIGLMLGYEAGPVAVSANYGKVKLVNGAGNAKSWGAAANYDLGGGAVVEFGYANDVRDVWAAAEGGKKVDQWSLGLGLTF